MAIFFLKMIPNPFSILREMSGIRLRLSRILSESQDSKMKK